MITDEDCKAVMPWLVYLAALQWGYKAQELRRQAKCRKGEMIGTPPALSAQRPKRMTASQPACVRTARKVMRE